MTHHTGSVPDTEPGRGWLLKAACRSKDVHPDWMFPDNDQKAIARAKNICARCPVRIECLADAIRVGDNQWGIRGGLKDKERRAVAKALGGAPLTDREALRAAVQHVLNPVTATRTLKDVWDEYSHPLPLGHIGWRGPVPVTCQGRSYTPGQIAFILHRGRPAQGPVHRGCGTPDCFHPLHIQDSRERNEERAPAAVG